VKKSELKELIEEVILEERISNGGDRNDEAATSAAQRIIKHKKTLQNLKKESGYLNGSADEEVRKAAKEFVSAVTKLMGMVGRQAKSKSNKNPKMGSDGLPKDMSDNMKNLVRQGR